MSGKEIPTSEETLHVDCSAAGTGFPQVKKIFSGSTINLQMVQVPQPTFSGSIIAAIEIALPDDDEKKNDICTPIPAPQEKEDWLTVVKESLLNADKIGSALGITWMRSKRLCQISHISLLDFAWIIIYMLRNQKATIQKMDEILAKLE